MNDLRRDEDSVCFVVNVNSDHSAAEAFKIKNQVLDYSSDLNVVVGETLVKTSCGAKVQQSHLEAPVAVMRLEK